MSDKPLVVSACLLGVRCRYDGRSKAYEKVVQYLDGRHVMPVCPEQLGGLPTPRPKAEIEEGKRGIDVFLNEAEVYTEEGRRVTDAFRKGAEETWRLARLLGAEEALLKERSPSCGLTQIYSGRFDSELRKGTGVTAALLSRKGLEVFSEQNLRPE